MAKDKSINPTKRAYASLDAAYAFFNKTLFGGELPDCLITMQRRSRARGYFANSRFSDIGGQPDGVVYDEIALNPQCFDRSTTDVLSTLVHEQCHLWQYHKGRKPTRCYHDKQWSEKMVSVGLQPSHDGKVGGKVVGPHMTHYIIEGGPFAEACAKFLEKNEASLYRDVWPNAEGRRKLGKAGGTDGGDDGDGEGGTDAPAKQKGRIKFTCPGCKLNAWAKPSAKLGCLPCKKMLEATEEATQ